MIVLNDVVHIGNDFSLVALDNEFFFLPNSTEGIVEEKLFALNPTAYFVASCIDGEKTVDELVELLCRKTAAAREVVEKDVLELVNVLFLKDIVCK